MVSFGFPGNLYGCAKTGQAGSENQDIMCKNLYVITLHISHSYHPLFQWHKASGYDALYLLLLSKKGERLPLSEINLS